MANEDMIELASIEEIIKEILDIVRKGQVRRQGPVHMTYVGGQFTKRAGLPFEQYMNYVALSHRIDVPREFRKLVPFIKKYAKSNLIVNDLGDGIFTIDEVLPSTPDVNLPSSVDDKHPRYKKGVWLAFIRPLEHNKRRYLNLSDRAGFTDILGDPSDDSWKEVGKDHILAIPQDQPVDPKAVIDKITSWALEIGIPLDSLHESEITTRFRKPTLSDLAKIIDSLPNEVTEKWHIPADVIKHLQR